MKIAFITSRLEPGQDGVGDYTRALAKECVRQGHECFLVALCERASNQSVPNDNIDESAKDASGRIAELRLPTRLSWNERQIQVQDALNAFDPNWVSLQFVPYGFHEKGVVSGLADILGPLVKNRRFHIMFHELWIGDYAGASAKERLTGKLQRYFILKLHKKLRPNLVHTSNPTYLARLSQNGIAALVLRMFGAVPIAAQRDKDWVFSQLSQGGVAVNEGNRESYLLLGIFGSLHLVWPAEPLFTYLQRASKLSGCRFVLLAIGRLGAGEQLWDKLAHTYAAQFDFVKLGELPVERISQVFHEIDCGIATSPYSIIGKSSTVAAMLEHGLPVIVNRNDTEWCSPAEQNQEPLLHLMDESLPDELNRGLPRLSPSSRLPLTARQFLQDLNAVS